MIARSVANPMPAGSPSSQKRSRQPKSAANLRAASSGSRQPAVRISDCASMQLCSVSSEHMPLPDGSR